MKCPFCRSDRTDVYNTRSTRFATQIWRRRRCLDCNEAFTTYEAPDLSFLVVRDAHGKKTRYSRSVLFSGVYQAFAPTPPRPETIDAVTDTIEAKLLDLKSPQISTGEIERIVLSTLKHFDTGAFVRYLTTHAGAMTPAQLKRELGRY